MLFLKRRWFSWAIVNFGLIPSKIIFGAGQLNLLRWSLEASILEKNLHENFFAAFQNNL